MEVSQARGARAALEVREKMTRLFILCTLLLSSAVYAHSDSEPRRTPAECAALLAPDFEAWAAIGEEYGPIQVRRRTRPSSHYVITAVLREDPSVKVGKLDVAFDGHTLFVYMIEVSSVSNQPPFKRRGVSRYLFAKALAQFPEAKKVMGSLFLDNAKAYHKVYDMTANMSSSFRNTPFYKAFAALGFSSIDEENSSYVPDVMGGTLTLTLQRPEEAKPLPPVIRERPPLPGAALWRKPPQP
ncbi:MAG: hypothetical protein KF799_10440 [Bdellovibrionales bacterium]|nr:hypothetical protein [Bdellovibrionales bacterium]